MQPSAYAKPCQTSKMEFSCKNSSRLKAVIFVKISTLNVWQSSQYNLNIIQHFFVYLVTWILLRFTSVFQKHLRVLVKLTKPYLDSNKPLHNLPIYCYLTSNLPFLINFNTSPRLLSKPGKMFSKRMHT